MSLRCLTKGPQDCNEALRKMRLPQGPGRIAGVVCVPKKPIRLVWSFSAPAMWGARTATSVQGRCLCCNRGFGPFRAFLEGTPLKQLGASPRFTWPAPKTTRPMDPSWMGFLESQPSMGVSGREPLRFQPRWDLSPSRSWPEPSSRSPGSCVFCAASTGLLTMFVTP